MFLVFLFLCYLLYAYGADYDPNNPNTRKGCNAKPKNVKEVNIIQRTFNLILYDFCVCIYVFLFIFFTYWAISFTEHLEAH